MDYICGVWPVTCWILPPKSLAKLQTVWGERRDIHINHCSLHARQPVAQGGMDPTRRTCIGQGCTRLRSLVSCCYHALQWTYIWRIRESEVAGIDLVWFQICFHAKVFLMTQEFAKLTLRLPSPQAIDVFAELPARQQIPNEATGNCSLSSCSV